MLDTMGIGAFADRARRELLATGETARKRTAETSGAADRPGGPGRAAGPRRPVQPGDRRPAVHQRPHGPVPPGQGLHQARHQLPRPARPRAARRAGHRPAALAHPSRAAAPAATGHSHCQLADASAACPELTMTRNQRATAKERHRDHLAEHAHPDAVPGHRRADGPLRREREPRRSRPAAQPVAGKPARVRADVGAAGRAHPSGGDRPARVRSFPAPRCAAVAAGDGRVRHPRRRRLRARAARMSSAPTSAPRPRCSPRPRIRGGCAAWSSAVAVRRFPLQLGRG